MSETYVYFHEGRIYFTDKRSPEVYRLVGSSVATARVESVPVTTMPLAEFRQIEAKLRAIGAKVESISPMPAEL